MRGTVRTLSPAIRDLAEERMKQIVEGRRGLRRRRRC
jgi:metal-dependent amidase/aminoacylase/carboxypeptidase family protein